MYILHPSSKTNLTFLKNFPQLLHFNIMEGVKSFLGQPVILFPLLDNFMLEAFLQEQVLPLSLKLILRSDNIQKIILTQVFDSTRFERLH